MSEKSARRSFRFKDSFRGSIQYRGSSYPCLVEDISQRGLRLLCDAPVNVGDRLNAALHISPDTGFSCVIEVRQITGNRLRGEIIDIAEADAGVLNDRIEGHYSAVRQAKERAVKQRVNDDAS